MSDKNSEVSDGGSEIYSSQESSIELPMYPESVSLPMCKEILFNQMVDLAAMKIECAEHSATYSDSSTPTEESLDMLWDTVSGHFSTEDDLPSTSDSQFESKDSESKKLEVKEEHNNKVPAPTEVESSKESDSSKDQSPTNFFECIKCNIC